MQPLRFAFSLTKKNKIEINPHQVAAFTAAIKALKSSGGIILADEVGLGKTIEAGLVLKYVLESGAKRILIVLPASLRKQWEEELKEKFRLETVILDRSTVRKEENKWRKRLLDYKRIEIILASYNYANNLMQTFPEVKWDFIIIDEAHNLRNVFHGAKRARNLYELSQGIPKILLTATPIQNYLQDLYGLVSFINPNIFGSEDEFLKICHWGWGGDFTEVKRRLKPVLYRTLRRDVANYMSFTKRICKTVDFALLQEESELYERVNAFLKRDELYSVSVKNPSLIILVMRKLLASSSFALIETFEVFKNRLKKLYEGTKSADAKEGFELFWDFVEDEIDEEDFEENADDGMIAKKKAIQDELNEVNAIIDVAKRITTNAKIEALKAALKEAFSFQRERGLAEKAVVFTESTRTQSYIAEELRKAGYDDDDILIFNGSFGGALHKKILAAFKAKHFGEPDLGLAVTFKHAIVDYFKDNAKILVCTDVASEGLNLQFCSTLVNYDLPWNPMKIEQRIGRCHRYGQKNDVVVINMLNTQNEADKRVYEILSNKLKLFDGVFGSSDIALGALETGVGFEKMVLEIYQSCNTAADFKREFDNLESEISCKIEESSKLQDAEDARSILRTESSEEKKQSFDVTNADIRKYERDKKYWSKFDDAPGVRSTRYLRVDDWGENVMGAHGTLFIGAFGDAPAMLVCDENGAYVPYDDVALSQKLEQIDDMDLQYFTPAISEVERYKAQANSIKELSKIDIILKF